MEVRASFFVLSGFISTFGDAEAEGRSDRIVTKVLYPFGHTWYRIPV